MAIPFVMPGEEPDDNLDQLIIELSDIIIQIQLLLRERARRQMMERRNRVCCAASASRRSRHVSHVALGGRASSAVVANEPSTSFTLPTASSLNLCGGTIESVSSLTSEDDDDADVDDNVGINRRTRANSESCSKEATVAVDVDVDVDVGDAAQNWTTQDDGSPTAEKTSCSQDGNILSKFVPTPFKSSIWTAVICVVGWHLLRTR